MPGREDVFLGPLAVRTGRITEARYWTLLREFLSGPTDRGFADLLLAHGDLSPADIEALRALDRGPSETILDAGSERADARCRSTVVAERPTDPRVGAALPTAVPPPDAAQPVLGKYRILGELGRGGMGVVYRAMDPDSRRTVALKVLPPAGAAKEETVQRFQREIRTAANLRHPNIVSIHDVGTAQDAHYFTMDYIEGKSLAEIVSSRPPAVREALEWVRTVALALQYAHERGIVHRDIKPSNILVDRHGTPYLTDFGLAKEIDSATRITFSGQVMGTPSYMSPEQANGELAQVDGCSDVYSLGAVLYECLTREPPFADASPAIVLYRTLNVDPTPVRRRNPRVHIDVETICHKALQKERSRRYPTARELAEDIGRFLGGEPIVARPIGTLTRALRMARKNRPALAAVVLAAIVVAALALQHQVATARMEARLAEERRRSERRRNAEALLQSALLEHGDARIEAIGTAIAADPTFPAARHARGVQYLYRGDFAGALADLQAVETAYALAAIALARFDEEARHDPERAAARFRLVAGREPDAPAGRFAAACLARRSGDPRAALGLLHDLLTAAEVQAAAQMEAAASSLAAEDRPGAAAAAKRALELEPDDPRPHLLLARIDLEAACYESALPHLDCVLDLAPAYPEPHRLRATILQRMGRTAEAEAAFTLALAADEHMVREFAARPDPGRAGLRHERGLARLQLGKLVEALDDFGAAAPDFAPAWTARGRAHLLQGRPADARAAFQEAVRLDPHQAEAWANLADLPPHAADEEARIGLWRKALATGRLPGTPWGDSIAEADLALAQLQAKTSQTAEHLRLATPAVRAYHRALLVHPRSTAALLGLAAVAAHCLDPARADGYLDRAIRANPVDFEPWMRRGILARDYPRLGLADQAEADFRRARELSPDRAEVWFHSGFFHERRDDRETACGEFHRALALDPRFGPAWRRLSGLRIAAGDADAGIHAYRSWRDSPADRTLSHLHWGLAEAYEEKKEYGLALNFYDQAMDWDPTYPQVYHSRARIYQRKNMLGAYVLDISRAIEFDPTDDAKRFADFWTIRTKLPLLLSLAKGQVDTVLGTHGHEPAAHFAAGFVALLADAWPRAEERLRACVELSPGFHCAHTLLGYVLHRLGHDAEAREELAGALSRQPDSALIPYFLACIEAGAGRRDEALALLEQAAERGMYTAELAPAQPEFAGLRENPRFQGALKGK